MAFVEVIRRSMRPEEWTDLRYSWLRRGIIKEKQEITDLRIRDARQISEDQFEYYPEGWRPLVNGDMYFTPDGTAFIEGHAVVSDELKGKGAISVDTEFPETTTSVSNLMESLPDTVDVTIGDTQYTGTPVEWSMDDRTAALGDYALGDVTVTGNLTELNREFTVTAFNCPASLVYFADCATGTDNPSEIFDRYTESRHAAQSRYI